MKTLIVILTALTTTTAFADLGTPSCTVFTSNDSHSYLVIQTSTEDFYKAYDFGTFALETKSDFLTQAEHECNNAVSAICSETPTYTETYPAIHGADGHAPANKITFNAINSFGDRYGNIKACNDNLNEDRLDAAKKVVSNFNRAYKASIAPVRASSIAWEKGRP